MKLLIVDDEKLIVAGLAHMIDSFDIPNISVQTAFRGTQALDIMEKDFIDLVLVDVAMPGMNGLELIQNAQKKMLCSNFIIISGRQDFAFVQQALRSGVIDYLLKPIQRDELRSLLIRCADKPENEDAVSNKYIALAIRRIREDYRKNLTLTDVAIQLGLNPNYLSGLFKKETGMNFSRYLMNERITQAEKILREQPSISVEAVGSMVGYSEPRQFYKAFKEITGQTPRKSTKKTEECS